MPECRLDHHHFGQISLFCLFCQNQFDSTFGAKSCSLCYVKNNSMEDLRLGYSIRHNWLIGGRFLKTPMNEDLMINSNWLLKRWNKVGSQANIFFLSIDPK